MSQTKSTTYQIEGWYAAYHFTCFSVHAQELANDMGFWDGARCLDIRATTEAIPSHNLQSQDGWIPVQNEVLLRNIRKACFLAISMLRTPEGTSSLANTAILFIDEVERKGKPHVFNDKIKRMEAWSRQFLDKVSSGFPQVNFTYKLQTDNDIRRVRSERTMQGFNTLQDSHMYIHQMMLDNIMKARKMLRDAEIYRDSRRIGIAKDSLNAELFKLTFAIARSLVKFHMSQILGSNDMRSPARVRYVPSREKKHGDSGDFWEGNYLGGVVKYFYVDQHPLQDYQSGKMYLCDIERRYECAQIKEDTVNLFVNHGVMSFKTGVFSVAPNFTTLRKTTEGALERTFGYEDMSDVRNELVKSYPDRLVSFYPPERGQEVTTPDREPGVKPKVVGGLQELPLQSASPIRQSNGVGPFTELPTGRWPNGPGTAVELPTERPTPIRQQSTPSGPPRAPPRAPPRKQSLNPDPRVPYPGLLASASAQTAPWNIAMGEAEANIGGVIQRQKPPVPGPSATYYPPPATPGTKVPSHPPTSYPTLKHPSKRIGQAQRPSVQIPTGNFSGQNQYDTPAFSSTGSPWSTTPASAQAQGMPLRPNPLFSSQPPRDGRSHGPMSANPAFGKPAGGFFGSGNGEPRNPQATSAMPVRQPPGHPQRANTEAGSHTQRPNIVRPQQAAPAAFENMSPHQMMNMMSKQGGTLEDFEAALRRGKSGPPTGPSAFNNSRQTSYVSR